MIFLWGALNSAPPAGVKATSSLGTEGSTGSGAGEAAVKRFPSQQSLMPVGL